MKYARGLIELLRINQDLHQTNVESILLRGVHLGFFRFEMTVQQGRRYVRRNIWILQGFTRMAYPYVTIRRGAQTPGQRLQNSHTQCPASFQPMTRRGPCVRRDVQYYSSAHSKEPGGAVVPDHNKDSCIHCTNTAINGLWGQCPFVLPIVEFTPITWSILRIGHQHEQILMLSSTNSTTPIHRFCVVLQLSHIHFRGTALQHQTQPIDRCDTVFGRKPPCFTNPGQPLQFEG